MPPSGCNTPAQCEICYKFISRSADLPRHRKTHAENKEDLKYPCTYPGCNYGALQMSNLETHKRTHTGERSKKCPQPGCGFSCTDPARLTRHRKGRHNYEPEERRNPAGKNTRRAAAAPYPSSHFVAPEVEMHAPRLRSDKPKKRRNPAGKDARRAAAAPSPPARLASPEVEIHAQRLHGYEPKERRNTNGKDTRRAAAAPYPPARVVVPEALFPVMGSHLLSTATQVFSNARASSPIYPGSDSSPISQRGCSPSVVSPLSSPYLPTTSSRRSFSPVSPLSARGSTCS